MRRRPPATHCDSRGRAAPRDSPTAKPRSRSAPAEGGHTLLAYAVKAQVGGKLAQIGSRLIDGAAAKIADDFFAQFLRAPRASGNRGGCGGQGNGADERRRGAARQSRGSGTWRSSQSSRDPRLPRDARHPLALLFRRRPVAVAIVGDDDRVQRIARRVDESSSSALHGVSRASSASRRLRAPREHRVAAAHAARRRRACRSRACATARRRSSRSRSGASMRRHVHSR